MIFPLTKPAVLMLQEIYHYPGIRFTDLLRKSRISSQVGNATLKRLLTSRIIKEQIEKSGKKTLERRFFPKLDTEEGFYCFSLIELETKAEFLDKVRSLRGPLEQFIREAKPEVVLVFGSFANDSATKESDLDLLILTNHSEKLKKMLERSFVTFSHSLSPRVESLTEFHRNIQDSFHQTIIQNHVIIYGVEKFVKLKRDLIQSR